MVTIMNTTTNAVEEICSVVHCLNQIIETTGPIDINNKTIWQGYLHRWTNEDWRGMLCVMGEIIAETWYNQPWHVTSLEQAISVFLRDQDHPRCMDRKPNKAHAWRMIMTMREVVNAVWGTRIPNQ